MSRRRPAPAHTQTTTKTDTDRHGTDKPQESTHHTTGARETEGVITAARTSVEKSKKKHNMYNRPVGTGHGPLPDTIM